MILFKELEKWIHYLERLLGRKTEEVEIMYAEGRYDIVIENSDSAFNLIFLIDHETGATWTYHHTTEQGWIPTLFHRGSNDKEKLFSFEPNGEILRLHKNK